jgi:hypothetical protein
MSLARQAALLKHEVVHYSYPSSVHSVRGHNYVRHAWNDAEINALVNFAVQSFTNREIALRFPSRTVLEVLHRRYLLAQSGATRPVNNQHIRKRWNATDTRALLALHERQVLPSKMALSFPDRSLGSIY